MSELISTVFRQIEEADRFTSVPNALRITLYFELLLVSYEAQGTWLILPVSPRVTEATVTRVA